MYMLTSLSILLVGVCIGAAVVILRKPFRKKCKFALGKSILFLAYNNLYIQRYKSFVPIYSQYNFFNILMLTQSHLQIQDACRYLRTRFD